MMQANEPFTCFACMAFFEGWPSNPCPSCGAWNTIRWGRVDGVGQKAGPHALGENVAPLSRHSTGMDALDLLLGGATHSGLVDGHLVLLVGPPGAGKTTLGLQLCAKANHPLFISAEQPEEEVASRAKEMGILTGGILFHTEVEISAIERMVTQTKATDVIVDSLACIWDQKKGSEPGNAHTMKNAARRLFELAHANKATIWLIGHVNKKSRASGPMAALHWCDVLLGYDVLPDETRVLHFPNPKKNRGGPTIGEMRMRMGAEGLTEVRAVAHASDDSQKLPLPYSST